MSDLFLLLPLLLLGWLFWSQRRRQQQMSAAQDQVKIGAEVGTTSGLLGTLVALDDQVGTIEVSPGVNLRFVRQAIVPREQVFRRSGGRRPAPAETAQDTPSSEPVDLKKHDDHDPETKAE
ncbi:preprotein translocase subunit YajC [Flexivirga caeni]|uniref:Preprotein translocase subunit YajC n=1 Tax=Flexivirga caeni TaxID=2294115 RepID=A0A3M9ME13_9MICO|nr:preprotein translocase subunit YajC [Flexivirga caeni]RNI22848.1 preprotein translocase subunit YajC [Flexivirga caeni]